MSGSGGGGGYEYQAKATAYVAAHILSGQRLNWIENGKADIPVAVAEETGGAGDDLNITLEDSTVIELQAKHGLKKDDKFWKAILKLGQGLKENENLYGVLLTDSTASKVLREDLRQDLKRLGQGRFDRLKKITKEVQNKFQSTGLPTEETEFFQRLRIVVLDLDDGLQDEKQAHLLLTQVLCDSAQASLAWSVLCSEGQSLLSNCGRRDATAWARLLNSKGILIKSTYAQRHGTITTEEKKYLERLLARHKSWWERSVQFLCEIQGIELSAWHPFTLSVESRKPRIRQESSGVESEEEKPKPILELLQSSIEEPVLIFGKPGAGKSTFLEQALFELAQKACKRDQDSRIPVLIQVKPNSTQSNFLYLIKECLENQTFLLGQKEDEKIIYIENLINQNRLFLLIDIVNELPRETQASLKDFCDRGIPMIVAMRDIGAGGLGIREKFEIQSLKSQYVQEFFQTRLPSHSQQDIQTLCERVRDFGQTPLMVWMLYSIFIQTGQTPRTRGEAYRIFTTVYEEEAKGGITLDESKAVLAEVSLMMTNSNKHLLESEIKAKFGSQPLKSLLANHLLYWSGAQGLREVNFCHPSLQEYYTAQYLINDRERLETWLMVDSNQQYSRFQQDYLNYTKWTEPIALLLGLCEEEIAIPIVEQALAVDLMLGARLAGEVRSDFQEKTLQALHQETPGKYSLFFLKKQFVDRPQKEVRTIKNNNKQISDSNDENIDIDSLIKIVENPIYGGEFLKAAKKLSTIDPGKFVYILLKIAKDVSKDKNIRYNAIKGLKFSKCQSLIAELIILLEDSEELVCFAAIESLTYLYAQEAIPPLLKMLENSPIYYKIIESLEHISSKSNEEDRTLITEKLLEILNNDPEKQLSESVVKALGTIKAKSAIPVLIEMLHHNYDDHDFQCIIIHALGNIGDVRIIDDLICLLSYSLSQIGNRKSWSVEYYDDDDILNGLPILSSSAGQLLSSLPDRDKEIVIALGNLRAFKAIPLLWKAVDYFELNIGQEAFQAIRYIQFDCKFYNYEIYLKTIDRKPPARGNPTIPYEAELVQIIENNYGTVIGNHTQL